jgi:hypothetical protein
MVFFTSQTVVTNERVFGAVGNIIRETILFLMEEPRFASHALVI